MENRYRGQWIVPLSHCDETGRLSVQGALGEFMDIAALHAEQIGVGGADMAKSNGAQGAVLADGAHAHPLLQAARDDADGRAGNVARHGGGNAL